LPSQQLAPQAVCPTAHCWQTPLTQFPPAQSEFWMHWEPTGRLPGSWQLLRRSVSLALVSRQIGWTLTPLTTLTQQSLSTLHW